MTDWLDQNGLAMLVGRTVQYRVGFLIYRGVVTAAVNEDGSNLRLDLHQIEWRYPFRKNWWRSKKKGDSQLVYDYAVIRDERHSIIEIMDTAFFRIFKLRLA